LSVLEHHKYLDPNPPCWAKHEALVREANKAFGMDFTYAEKIALAKVAMERNRESHSAANRRRSAGKS